MGQSVHLIKCKCKCCWTFFTHFRQWIGGDDTNQYLWWNGKNAQKSWMETKELSEVRNRWWNRYCVKLNIIPLSTNARVNQDNVCVYPFLPVFPRSTWRWSGTATTVASHARSKWPLSALMRPIQHAKQMVSTRLTNNDACPSLIRLVSRFGQQLRRNNSILTSALSVCGLTLTPGQAFRWRLFFCMNRNKPIINRRRNTVLGLDDIQFYDCCPNCDEYSFECPAWLKV